VGKTATVFCRSSKSPSRRIRRRCEAVMQWPAHAQLAKLRVSVVRSSANPMITRRDVRHRAPRALPATLRSGQPRPAESSACPMPAIATLALPPAAGGSRIGATSVSIHLRSALRQARPQ
jgi:hypothetical protein